MESSTQPHEGQLKLVSTSFKILCPWILPAVVTLSRTVVAWAFLSGQAGEKKDYFSVSGQYSQAGLGNVTGFGNAAHQGGDKKSFSSSGQFRAAPGRVDVSRVVILCCLWSAFRK